MTLSPVFRSESAVRLLHEEGIWEALEPAVASQARAVRRVLEDLDGVIDESFLDPMPALPDGRNPLDPEALGFLQEYFFLILFRSLFESVGVHGDRLDRYAEVNFCIKGTITAADNLFDDQAKSLLPLAATDGPRFHSILQLMCFERLIRRSLDRWHEAGDMEGASRHRILKGLIDLMGEIGRLEGSEEGGVKEIPEPAAMVDAVHRIRGGALFALAFVAPAVLEEGEVAERMARAEPAVARLGTAFQIVDDLTDFEFDVGRRSHNLLVSEIHHNGGPDEQALLSRLRSGEVQAGPSMVEGPFQRSARAVLQRAYDEARGAFSSLEALGFWFPTRLADDVVHAIVGLEGVRRMERLAVE
ncbi:MAG: hypothetical protein EA352_03390 [Gemmatimonadales bacterium]|nr:MAG: hypothetical protein EA352_03390 [Gemmatimonadales bacterium]